NYAANNADLSHQVAITMFDATKPGVRTIERFETFGVLAAIIDSTWDYDFEGRCTTWRDGKMIIRDRTRESAIVAQAAAVPADEPCNFCANNCVIFAQCSQNMYWPENGATTSCGYWGRSRHCSFVPVPTIGEKTPSKCRFVQSAIKSITNETDKVTSALAALKKEIKDLPFLRWESAANALKAMHEICEKAVEFFKLQDQARKDAAERAQQLKRIMRL
ncbi:hypothetical protein KEM55_002637, partial [Ascosphaera atra]